jgi:N-methylhydantoinase A/oxoprolinase/acetone carboxylase beta subunit
MNDVFTIGVDIGGTNTDVVLVDSHEKIVYAYKTMTTADIVTGFVTAIKNILAETHISPSCIKEVLVGTTHATNALLQNNHLGRVGVIRIAGNKPLLPPCYGWPEEARKSIFSGVVTVNGGFECHGNPITEFLPFEVERATHELLEQGADGIAIIGAFSPLNNRHELLAQQIVWDIAGRDFPITLSSGLGGVGFIERENSAILNSALKKIILNGFKKLKESLLLLSIPADLFITQNNGTLISIDQAMASPILTISAGQTNSFIGATRLAKLTDAVVVDIGGTSTDVGIVLNNFPRRTVNSSYIAGISLNFPMPDVLSVALGGGSHVALDNHNNWQIGPQSSGCNVLNESFSFGGSRLTLTDVALVCQTLKIKNSDSTNVPLELNQGQEILESAKTLISSLIHRISGPKQALPIVLVGGGSHLIPIDLFAEDFSICIPHNSHVANAYGAALAEISGTVDTVVSLNDRENVLKQLQEEAFCMAINRGACKNSARIVNQQIIPFHYVPNNLARVIITVAGKRKK